MSKITFQIPHDGLVRECTVFVPSGYAGKPMPLVLGFHAGLTSGEFFERQTQFSRLAERQGFLVAYPEGTGHWRTWNAGHCCGWAQMEDVDDVGFVARLLDELAARYNVAQFFATGFSNGACLCHRLGCEIPSRFAAIAVASGSMWDRLTPPQSLPVFITHGLADQNIPWAGGVGRVAMQKINHQAGEATVGKWKAVSPDVQVSLLQGVGHVWMPATTPAVWDFFNKQRGN